MYENDYIRRLENPTKEENGSVGGRNASPGERIQTLESEGVRVPGRFASTADAYRAFFSDKESIDSISLNPDSVSATIRQLTESSR